MVIGFDAAAAAWLAESVRVLLVVPAAIEVGENEAVTPVGNPSAVSAIAPANPFTRVMVIGTVAVPPCGALTAAPAVRVIDAMPIVSCRVVVFDVTPVPEPRSVIG